MRDVRGSNEGGGVFRSGGASARDGAAAPFGLGRLPVALRAIVSGFLVLVAGNFLPQGMIAANLKSPAVPWAAPAVAFYLWLYWRYVGGHGWPRATSEARRRSLRANRLSPEAWGWSLAAGVAAIAALFAVSFALARVAPGAVGTVPPALSRLPVATLVAVVVSIAAVAGVAEEAAFRGYMQGPIERRHGPLAAVALGSVAFALAHLPGGSSAAPRLLVVLLAGVFYGVLARLADSILPGIVLHVAQDLAGAGLACLAARGDPAPSGAGWPSAAFAGALVAAFVLGAGSVACLRRLAAVSVRLRPAVAADGGAICALHKASIEELCGSWYAPGQIQAWAGFLAPERYMAPIADPDRRFLVAETAAGPVGFGILDVREGEVDAVYVHPAQTRRGIGRRLLGRLVEDARGAGLGELHLTATLNAVRFYENGGFEVVRRGEFSHPSGVSLACVFMRRDLGRGLR